MEKRDQKTKASNHEDKIEAQSCFSGCSCSRCTTPINCFPAPCPSPPSSSACGNNYVFAYDTTTQSVAAANTYQNVTFSTNGQLNGWTHTAGTAEFTATQTGIYLITYIGTADPDNGADQTMSMRATNNGAEIPGSQAAIQTDDSADQAIEITRTFLNNFVSGDVLRIQFTGTDTDNQLIGLGEGTTTPSASITITRIT